MNELTQYISDATRTESLVDQVEADPNFLAGVLQIFIASGNMLDQIKKNAFYGKEYDNEKLKDEFINVVGSLEQVKPFISGTQAVSPVAIDPRVFHSLVGIATEAAELLEAMISEAIDPITILEEFGDLNWYQAIGIDALGGSFGEVLRTNIEKLRARYPEKFTNEAALNRNIDKERKILEQNPLKG